MTTNIQDPQVRAQLSYIDQASEENNSDVVRSEIEATRHRVSNRLDQIQERLQPENIKQQTQETIQSALVESLGSAKEYVDEYVQQINWAEVRDGVLDSVRRNPVPVALIGVGLGWMLINNSRSHPQLRNAPNRRPAGQPHREGIGWREETPEMASRGASAARYSNSKSSPATGSVKETVNEVGEKVRDGATQVKNSVQRQASDIVGQIQESAGQIGNDVGEWIEDWQQSGESASEWGQEKFNDLSAYTQRSLDENPLLFGAVALAVGAGLGMLLPGTHYENQLLGGLRQQTVQAAQEMVGEVKDRAQTAIEEIQPDIEKAATTVAKNIGEAGKQAISEVRQSLQSTTRKIAEASESKRE